MSLPPFLYRGGTAAGGQTGRESRDGEEEDPHQPNTNRLRGSHFVILGNIDKKGAKLGEK